MKYLIIRKIPNDEVVKRGLKSEHYTISKTAGLCLYEVAVMDFDPMDEDTDYYDERESALRFSCELWAPDNKGNPAHTAEWVNARLKEYFESNLDSTVEDSFDVVYQWATTVNPSLIGEYSLIEAAKIIEHCMYVQRKFAAMVSELEAYGAYDALNDVMIVE